MSDSRVGAARFSFRYQTPDGSHQLDSYDAAEAMYGIARSLAIATHYSINNRIIKQAPSLKGAKILLSPPQRGSFEFLLSVLQTVDASQNLASVAQGLESSFLYDLTKYLFARLTGQAEKVSSERLRQVQRQAPGDLDALSDCINEDVVRIQRPIARSQFGDFHLHVHGGTVNIGNFDQDTYDFAKTKIRGREEEEYFGHVQSYNGSTHQGRFWLEVEDRTVGFSINRDTSLAIGQRRMLAWSLNQWVNNKEANIYLTGYPLSSKTGLLKHVFITSVKRA